MGRMKEIYGEMLEKGEIFPTITEPVVMKMYASFTWKEQNYLIMGDSLQDIRDKAAYHFGTDAENIELVEEYSEYGAFGAYVMKGSLPNGEYIFPFISVSIYTPQIILY